MNARSHRSIVEQLRKDIADFQSVAAVERAGTVLDVGDGVARVSGLRELVASELVRVLDAAGTTEKAFGVALNLDEDQVSIVLLGETRDVQEGDMVQSTGRVLSVPIGEALLGRVVDPLGRPLDGGDAPELKEHAPLEKIAPGVITRRSVYRPLQTGILAIDAMIPIGRGQRELIIGDRQTGKTSIALDAILNQRGEHVVCVYVAIGQKQAKVARLVEELKIRGALEYTIIVVASASDPASLLFIAPYSGCTMAEYFRDKGRDALIVYDDLSKHAIAYREMSLLLGRPSGREAYPGDVFYLHSRLLERAAQLSDEHGGGSLTALPIVETQAGDVSAYIPTNIISITDGQIYLESDLFFAGIRPALNIGLSVSRIGSAAQTRAMKGVAGKLRLDLAQYRELAAFAQFGSELDSHTKALLERGKRITEALKQPLLSPVPVVEQVVMLFAVVNGLLDAVPVSDVRMVLSGVLDRVKADRPNIIESIAQKGDLSGPIKEELQEFLTQAVRVYTPHLSAGQPPVAAESEALPSKGAGYTSGNARTTET